MPASRTSPARPRPALSPREAQALREALALRQALEAGQTLTAAQVQVLRTATAAAVRTASPGTRQPVHRKTAPGRPGAKRAPSRKPASRRKVARRPATAPTRSRWSTRLGVVAMSTLLLPAVAVLVLPGSDDGGSAGGPLDATSLALTAQTSLLEQAGRYRQLELEVAQRQTELQQARDAEQAARAQVDADQAVVGSTAADLYRAAPTERLPILGLSIHQSAAVPDALYRQALAERADRALEGVVVRAERTGVTLAAATDRVRKAEAAVAAAGDRAADVLARCATRSRTSAPP